MCLRASAAVFLTLSSATIASAQTLTLTPISIPSQEGARGIATADFDGNGWADVAHANFGANTVTILLNQGGSLATSGDIPVGKGPFDMTSADFNMDGKADLAVANADANTISVLLGSGDGRFTRTDLAVTGNPRGLTAADMNHDGRPDLVYTGFTNNRVQILTGDGSGGFAVDWAIVGVAQRPQGVAAADFNKDGRLDLAVAYADGLGILTRTASGGLSARLVGGERNLNVVAVGDVDKDGWLDVAAASTASSRMAVFLGGASGMAWAATYTTGSSPRDVLAVDVDHDGWLDIVTANRGGDSVNVFLGRAAAPGSFTSRRFDAGDGSRAVVSADFNHDGLTDLVTGNEYEAGATLLLNHTILERAAFGFTRGTLPTDFGNSGDPLVGEFNHNGIPDLIVHDLNNPVAILDGETAVPLPGFMTVGAIADFNADGHQDLAARLWNGSTEVIRVMLGDGTGAFAQGPEFPLPVGGWFAAGDMDRNGRADILLTQWNPATQQSYIDVYLNHSSGWAAPKRFQLSSRWAISIQIADMNRDGMLDVVTSQFEPHMVHVMLGTGDGNLDPARGYGVPALGYVYVGDVSEDGAPDVVLGGWEETFVLLGSPTGDLALGSQYPFGSVWMALADMNQDGHVDIVSTHSALIAHGRGDGTFAEPEHFRFGMSKAVVADLNVDGLPDLIGGHVVAFNRRGTANGAPTIVPMRDWSMDYIGQFGEEDIELWAEASDPDMHALTFEWHDGGGDILQSGPRDLFPLRLPPGEYDITVTASDGRGLSASDTAQVTIRPNPELILSRAWWHGWQSASGTWMEVADSTAAGSTRFMDPNRGAPKSAAPAASPANYVHVEFAADPTQTYKLWVRLKAENDYWGNDSVWLQFSGAADVNGNPIYRTGTTSGLAVNLEACSNCGISGWGWRDERWGPTLAEGPVLLRFPQGGTQVIVVQTREDGVSIDQIVLSAERYRVTAPGPVKNDTTIVTGR